MIHTTQWCMLATFSAEAMRYGIQETTYWLSEKNKDRTWHPSLLLEPIKISKSIITEKLSTMSVISLGEASIQLCPWLPPPPPPPPNPPPPPKYFAWQNIIFVLWLGNPLFQLEHNIVSHENTFADIICNVSAISFLGLIHLYFISDYFTKTATIIHIDYLCYFFQICQQLIYIRWKYLQKPRRMKR